MALAWLQRVGAARYGLLPHFVRYYCPIRLRHFRRRLHRCVKNRGSARPCLRMHEREGGGGSKEREGGGGSKELDS
jgi:hypothetical protein